jgi:hypothetical protein
VVKKEDQIDELKQEKYEKVKEVIWLKDAVRTYCDEPA